MKATNLILILMLFCSLGLHSQTIEDRTQEQEILMALNNFSLSEAASQSISLNPGNNIFIQQVGKANEINSSISSPNARVNLNQTGNNNYMNLNIRTRFIRENVEQLGNNNKFFDFVNNPLEENHLNLQQHGNNNHVEKYGSNSISDGISYKVEGNFQSLIIRNYP